MKIKLFGFEGDSEDTIFRQYLHKLLSHRLGPTSSQKLVPVYFNNEQIGKVVLSSLEQENLYIHINHTLPKELFKYIVPTLSMSNAGYVYVEFKLKEVFNVFGVPVPSF